MKRKIIIGIVCLMGVVVLSSQAFGQAVATTAAVPGVELNPEFFMAVLAGVLLALGFQLVLTNLSVAAGITAIGDIRKKGMKNEPVKAPEKEKSDGKIAAIKKMPLGVLLMSGAGIWGMITMALSLFFATLIGVKLSLIRNNNIGISLGLVIWAVFFMTMLYLESKALGAVISGIFNTAVQAVKAGFAGVGSVFGIFGKSDAARIGSVVENSIDKIRNDIYDSIENADLKGKFDTVINKLDRKTFDMDVLKDQLIQLLGQISIEQREGDLPGVKELFLKVAQKQPKLSSSDVSTFERIFDTAKSVLAVAGVAGTIGGLGWAASNVSKNLNAHKIKQEVEDYMRQHSAPWLEPRVVQAELDEIFDHPAMVEGIISNKAHSFDKDSVVAVVTEKQGVSREEALVVAEKLQEAINAILRKANIAEMSSRPKGMVEGIVDKVKDRIISKKDDFISDLEIRFQHFFDRLERPELDYHLLKSEFEFVLQNPKLAPDVLKMKIKQMDSGTLMALLTSTGKFSRSDMEKIRVKYEEVKLKVLDKLDQAESVFMQKAEAAKAFALEEAENTRKTAVAASWWLFGTLIISGIAAVLGGMAAL